MFASLLAPRAVSVLAERAGRHHDPTGVGAWTAGPAVTAALTAVLDADATATAGLSRRGLPVPGLSTWAVAGVEPYRSWPITHCAAGRP